MEIRCSPGATLKGHQEREYEKFNRKRSMGGNFERVKGKLTHPARCLLPPLRFVGAAAYFSVPGGFLRQAACDVCENLKSQQWVVFLSPPEGQPSPGDLQSDGSHGWR